MVSDSWISMINNEFLCVDMWTIYNYSPFVSEDINLKDSVVLKNLTTWVKFASAIIYNQIS